MSRDEFITKAKTEWRDSFPLVIGFMDWVKENGYWELDNLDRKALKSVQNRYVENMLNGRDERGKRHKDENGIEIHIFGMMGWTVFNIPDELYTKIYGSTKKLLEQQYKGRMREPKYMIAGIGGISNSAILSILGLEFNEFLTSTDLRIVEFRRHANSMPKNPDELTSFSMVDPMVRIVDNLLAETFPEYQRSTREDATEAAQGPVETSIILTCESCGATESYEKAVLKTFGSVRCKNCGTRISASEK